MWSIPARVPGFTGREGLLAELDAAVHAGGRVLVAAVTGMGGVGKTSTVIEYAHRHRDEVDIAWWVPAEDPALVPARLAELAVGLSLAAEGDPVVVAVAALRAELAMRERWLVVFDNAEHPAALRDWLPEGPGRVLVTSRNPVWHGLDPVGVHEFVRGESITLLRKLVPDLSERDADRVAHLAQVPLTEDRHSVRDLRSDGQDEAFGEAVHPRTPGRDLTTSIPRPP